MYENFQKILLKLFAETGSKPRITMVVSHAEAIAIWKEFTVLKMDGGLPKPQPKGTFRVTTPYGAVDIVVREA